MDLKTSPPTAPSQGVGPPQSAGRPHGAVISPHTIQTNVLRGPNTVQKRVFARAIFGLSVAQVVFGCICIVMGSVALTKGSDDDYARMHANGIWSGIFFALTGAFGIIAGKTKATAWIVTTMVFCILSATLTITTVGYGAASVVQSEFNDYDDYYNMPAWPQGEWSSSTTTSGQSWWTKPSRRPMHPEPERPDDEPTDQYWGHYINDEEQERKISEGTAGILIIMGVTEAVIAIICACFCCHAVCCCSSTPGVVYTYPWTTTAPPTYYSSVYPGHPAPHSPTYQQYQVLSPPPYQQTMQNTNLQATPYPVQHSVTIGREDLVTVTN